MGRLEDVFKAQREGLGENAGPSSDLEDLLEEVYARGREAHPTLVVADEVFAAHLGRCGATLNGALEKIHAGDLYLVAAALGGHGGAVAQLRDVHRPQIEKSAGMGQSKAFLDEVEQRLWDGLLVGAQGGPRLATYSGTGPLERWIAISAQRIALMMLRHQKVESRAQQELAAQERLALSDPEIAAIKERYREHFQRAIEAALGTLEPREKMIYRMHLVEGLSLDRIGKVYRVHQSTVSRWLADTRVRITDEARKRLREELNLEASDFDSLVRLLISQLDINLSQALGKSV